jgi:peptidoglycan/LPS O-acetylase OafA/YrhL
MAKSAQAASHPALLPSRGRIIAIDIVRGFAILWVILYHLWTDIKFPTVLSVPDTFSAVPERIGEGAFPGMITAVSDAFLRVGYLGVPLFMILSGLSLTLVALRREMLMSDAPRFLYQRFRRVMIPYWFGFVYTLAFFAALAFVQWQREARLVIDSVPVLDGSWLQYFQHGDQSIDGGQLLAGGLMIPRMFKNEWQFAPEGSLWFVLVIVQYYLLFPVLLAVMKRTGPWLFLLVTLLITMLFLNLAVAIDGNLILSRHLIETAVPFRLFEFGLGMTAGYLMVHRPELMLEYTQAPLDIAGIVLIGLLLFVGGCMIDPVGGGGIVTFIHPLVTLGMSLIFLPLVMKVPGRLETSSPGRVVAWVGVISYTVLIINEPLRSVTHTMRNEDAAMAWQVLWIGVLYMPITLIAARPLAVLLGLVEREAPAGERTPASASTEPRSLHA